MDGWLNPGRAQAREGMQLVTVMENLSVRPPMVPVDSDGYNSFTDIYSVGQTFVLLMRPTDTLLSPEAHTHTHTHTVIQSQI